MTRKKKQVSSSEESSEFSAPQSASSSGSSSVSEEAISEPSPKKARRSAPKRNTVASKSSAGSAGHSPFALRPAAAPREVNEARIVHVARKGDASAKGGSVVYVIERDMRARDNWALLRAARVAAARRAPLVCAVHVVPAFWRATERHFDFMVRGLRELHASLRALRVPLHVTCGDDDARAELHTLLHKLDARHVITDYNPLRHALEARRALERAAPAHARVEVVDAHNIVPVEVASDKREGMARWLRPRIASHLREFCTEFPPLEAVDEARAAQPSDIDFDALRKRVNADSSVPPVSGIEAGESAAHDALRRFTEQHVGEYVLRNDANAVHGQSQLSPYLHFGHLAPQRAALAAYEVLHKAPKHREAIYSFLEELIVRRELSDNFVHYTPEQYDSLDAAAKWARDTLATHESDPREHVYSREQLEAAETHDEVWNAAQRQLRREGKMHGYVRMYWAKKVLEWTKKPEEALETELYLNDRYSLDGRDPNGVVGVMWSIAGIHDRGWTERAIFGKIRFMNYNGLKKHFDVKKYEKRFPEKK